MKTGEIIQTFVLR